jgi:hypothetical protein
MTNTRFIGLLAIALLFGFFFLACGGGGGGIMLGPVDTVKAFNDALFSGDVKTAAKYISEKDLPGNIEEMNFVEELEKQHPDARESFEKMVQSLKYTPVSEQGGKATVQVTMDMSALIGDREIPEAAKAMMPPMEFRIDYTLEKIGGRWLIVKAEPETKT